MSKEEFFIAQIGRTVGLWGDLKLNLHTDFPEQFKEGNTYKSDRGELTIVKINPERGIARFRGYEGVDEAKKLTNVKLYASEEQTKETCLLGEGEYFWFDIIGCSIDEEGELLGKVVEIQRMVDVDYLVIQTEDVFVSEGLPKSFLLPYIPRYILQTDIDSGMIFVQDAKEILEAS